MSSKVCVAPLRFVALAISVSVPLSIGVCAKLHGRNENRPKSVPSAAARAWLSRVGGPRDGSARSREGVR